MGLIGILLIGIWTLSGLTEAYLGRRCTQTCRHDHEICVGSPCDAICECEPGYKPCKAQGICIPDLSDTVQPGGNCTRDSECIGVSSFCRVTNLGNYQYPSNGTCVGGQTRMSAKQQLRVLPQSGGSSVIYSSVRVHLLGYLFAVVSVIVL